MAAFVAPSSCGVHRFEEIRSGVHRRRPARVLRTCVPRCTLNGVSFQTGKRLVLEEAGKGSSSASKRVAAPENDTVYIRCEECATCYQVRLPVPSRLVRCSVCGNEWDGSMSTPLQIALELEEEVEDEKRTDKRGKIAPAGGELKRGRRTESATLECEHFQKCPGCTISAKFEDTKSVHDAVAFGKKDLKLKDVAVVLGDIQHWRTSAKLAVRRKGKRLILGLYEARSHNILAIPRCVVHHPQINIVAAAIEHEANSSRIEAYNEMTGNGLLRYVQLMLERSSGTVSVTLVCNARTVKESNPGASILVKRLWSRRAELGLHSIWINFNTTRGNSVFAAEPNRWGLVRGDRFLREKVLDGTVFFLPSAFRQANLGAFETLLTSLVKYVPSGSRVVEFCAGVGAIGFGVLSKVELSSLLCTELNPASEEAFRKSVMELPASQRPSVDFEVGTAASLRERLNDADVVIADPPRSGLDYQFRELLCAPGHRTPSTFIYVSCGLSSFKQDAQRLLDGGWTAIHSEAHLFFPGSDHVETLAVFTR